MYPVKYIIVQIKISTGNYRNPSYISQSTLSTNDPDISRLINKHNTYVKLIINRYSHSRNNKNLLFLLKTNCIKPWACSITCYYSSYLLLNDMKYWLCVLLRFFETSYFFNKPCIYMHSTTHNLASFFKLLSIYIFSLTFKSTKVKLFSCLDRNTK